MFGYLIAGVLGYLVGSAYRASFSRRPNPIGGRGHMTKAQAKADFDENIKPAIIERYGPNDRPAMAEAWNDYTDMLQKDGLISEAQYSSWANPY